MNMAYWITGSEGKELCAQAAALSPHIEWNGTQWDFYTIRLCHKGWAHKILRTQINAMHRLGFIDILAIPTADHAWSDWMLWRFYTPQHRMASDGLQGNHNQNQDKTTP